MTPPFQLINADCIEACKTISGIDAVVCDPPYGLTQNKKGGSGPASFDPSTPHGRTRITVGEGQGGFMGMKWDRGVPGPEYWVSIMSACKPGAHLLAFGGTRTFHRLACAIEDAGWELRDTIMWVYGSGFPKSHNLEGEFEGRGTALKPAWEPIILARKPVEGTVAKNVQRHGCGALNIDACRIAVDESVDDPRLGGKGEWASDKMAKNVYEGGYAGDRVESSPLGRWPANVIHDGSDEVQAAFPDSKTTRNDNPSDCAEDGKWGSIQGRRPARGYDGDGSAARFFYCAKASPEDREEGCEKLAPKLFGMSGAAAAAAARGEEYDNGDGGVNKTSMRRNTHPTVKPTELMRYLCRLITPPGGLILDPFMGSGSTGKAAMLEGFRFIGIERDTEAGYMQIAEARIKAAIDQRARNTAQQQLL